MRAVTLVSLLICIGLASNHRLANSVEQNPLLETLLLTGSVKAQDNQGFYAPKTDNWRVQIKWMLPEGETAKAGELAVLFDSGSLESQIEQEEISLLAAKEELHRLIESGAQAVLKAKYAVTSAELKLKRAKVEANIAQEHIIEFEYQKFQVEYEKALVSLVKIQGKYQQEVFSDKVARTKQSLKITKHQESLNYQQYKLSKMALHAQDSGPILYNDYWNGEKIYVGMTVEVATKVAEIPVLSKLYIETWLHEIDYQKINAQQSATLTFDAFPKQQFPAKLTHLSTQPEEKKNWGSDVYFKAKFSFDSTASVKLLPGMSALLELPVRKNKQTQEYVATEPVNNINQETTGEQSE